MITALLWTATGVSLGLLGLIKPVYALNNGVARLPSEYTFIFP